jgi:hypothetical protein
MKRALFSWDTLDLPRISEARCQHLSHGSGFDAAYELICRPIKLDDEVKSEIHGILAQTVKSHIPTFYLYDEILDDQLGKKRPYPDEFLSEYTAEVLIELGMAVKREGKVFVGLKSLFLLAALLGDVAAGRMKQRLTDDLKLYKGLCQLLGADQPSEAPQCPHDLVLSLAIKTADLSGITLEQLVEFRRREYAEQRGDDLRQLRHKFSDHLTSLAKTLSDPAYKSIDHKEICLQAEEELKHDLREIGRELRVKEVQLVLSKEIFATALISIGSIATPLPVSVEVGAVVSAIGGIAAIYVARSKFFEARRDLLKNHPMAYLYEFDRSSK